MRARLSGIPLLCHLPPLLEPPPTPPPPPPREHAGVPPPPPKAGAAPLSQLNAGAHPAGVRGRPAPPGASEIAMPEIAARCARPPLSRTRPVAPHPCIAPGRRCPTPATRQAGAVTCRNLRQEIEREQICALHSCIENPENFRAFNCS
jgi:hypothetical protein